MSRKPRLQIPHDGDARGQGADLHQRWYIASPQSSLCAVNVRQGSEMDSLTVHTSFIATGAPLEAGMYNALSEPVEAWHFDLKAPIEEAETKSLDLQFSTDGRMNAVVFWYTLELLDGITFSTSPEAVASGEASYLPRRPASWSSLSQANQGAHEFGLGCIVQMGVLSPSSKSGMEMMHGSSQGRGPGFLLVNARPLRPALHELSTSDTRHPSVSLLLSSVKTLIARQDSVL